MKIVMYSTCTCTCCIVHVYVPSSVELFTEPLFNITDHLLKKCEGILIEEEYK